MVVELNHTIVNVKDKREAATFFAEMLGLPEPTSYGPFLVVNASNDVELAFLDVERLFPLFGLPPAVIRAGAPVACVPAAILMK